MLLVITIQLSYILSRTEILNLCVLVYYLLTVFESKVYPILYKEDGIGLPYVKALNLGNLCVGQIDIVVSLNVVVDYPTPSEEWGHGGRPWSPRSRATPQGLDQRS